MLRHHASIGILLALVSASCTSAPPPVVPVMANAPGARALAGTWEGEYSSEQTLRSGTIRFQLAAESDSAFGDVVMFPKPVPHRTSGNEVKGPPVDEAPPQTLSINFVMATGDSVFGLMDPYEGTPGSFLVTRFAGLIRADRIAGQYETRNLNTAETTTGTWSVRRKQ
jgi:hypothetical protein